MHPTKPLEKLLNSAINAALVFIIFSPFLFSDLNSTFKKLIFISLFLLYKFIIVIFNNNRSVGMIITKTYWKEKYPLKNQIFHAILYTVSFSTLLFWVYFPFDLFLINMLLLQLPTIILKGTTFHGYLAGNMLTVKK